MLLVDLSASQGLGTHYQTKRELVTELGATLAFSAIKNNDKVGLNLFTDGIEKVVPPAKGSRHVLRLILELMYCNPIGSGTDIRAALEHLNRTVKRRSIVFLISDFLTDFNYKDALKIANKKHDVVALRIIDKTEQELHRIGMIKLRDNESGRVRWIDTSDSSFRRQFAINQLKFEDDLRDTFTKSGTDVAKLYTHESYVKPLMNLFKNR